MACVSTAPGTGLKRRGRRSGVRCMSQLDIATLDTLLSQEGEGGARAARKEARALQNAGRLRGFGSALNVPKRQYSLAELRLNKIETDKLLSPTDSTLGSIRRNALAALGVGLSAFAYAERWGIQEIITAGMGSLALLSLDGVLANGTFEALIVDGIAQASSKLYRERVSRHEAGHFLIAYLLGVLPKSYTLSTRESFFSRDSFGRSQAGTLLCDDEFQADFESGKLTSSRLDSYCCIALAGVCVEYILYGQAEGGLSDIQQLDGLLVSLRFSQKKADDQVRWAVLNTVSLLRTHSAAHKALADAMLQRKTISTCIEVIESKLEASELMDLPS